MHEDFLQDQAESANPLGEDGVTGAKVGPVLDSEGLRRWLLPQIHSKPTQTQAAEWLGLAQSTVSRLINHDAYDFPLSTVANLATLFGYARLSDFVSHVEAQLDQKKQSSVERMTGPVTVKGDKSSAPLTSTDIEQGRPIDDQTRVSESDLRRAVAAVLTEVLTDVVSRLHTADALDQTSGGSPKPHSPPGKTPPHKNKRGSGNR